MCHSTRLANNWIRINESEGSNNYSEFGFRLDKEYLARSSNWMDYGS